MGIQQEKTENILSTGQIESKILHIRNADVILDSDVAKLYKVETRDINKAVHNNLDKFPDGYVLELKSEEKWELVENFHQFKRLKHSPVLPKAFTEKGLYMLATILKSKQATETTIEIIETFAKMRDLSRSIAKLPDEKDEGIQKTLIQKSSNLIGELLGKDLQTAETETSIEFNFAMLKVKHNVKQEPKTRGDITSKLNTAKELLDSGAINSTEFDEIKRILLCL